MVLGNLNSLEFLFTLICPPVELRSVDSRTQMIQGQEEPGISSENETSFFRFLLFFLFVSRRNIPPELGPDKLCWLNFGRNIIVIKSNFFI